jgi:hypothetical protein
MNAAVVQRLARLDMARGIAAGACCRPAWRGALGRVGCSMAASRSLHLMMTLVWRPCPQACA